MMEGDGEDDVEDAERGWRAMGRASSVPAGGPRRAQAGAEARRRGGAEARSNTGAAPAFGGAEGPREGTWARGSAAATAQVCVDIMWYYH